VEKVFDLELISILIVVTDCDRNLYFETLKLNFLAFVSIGLNSILLDIASRRWIAYKRLQIVGSNDYTLRHTALTNLGEKARGDVFVLARIAGHSSITVTQRYIHPQADAINRVFAASQVLVGTKLGAIKETPKLERRKHYSVTLRKRLNIKKKMVPGVGVEPLGGIDST